MKYVDEFRDPQLVRGLVDRLHRITHHSWVVMEVCGGQTHAIVKHGIQQMIPSKIELVHGPGCPVCVTPLELLDKAIILAARPDVVFTSFGDMLRVPGSNSDLMTVKSQGGDVRIVYSPLDAVALARKLPHKQVVFFAVGFETTAPTNAMAVWQAKAEGLTNFSVLVSHVLVPPAMTALLAASDNRVQGYLAAGHVCTIMGTEPYEPIAAQYKVPIVATGFEPTDVLEGLCMLVSQLEEGRCDVENQYARSVRATGNTLAQKRVQDVFEITDRNWRGIGPIPLSGLALRDAFKDFDAASRFELGHLDVHEPEVCQSGLVLRGQLKPYDCPAFGTQCTPQHPLGATMVSSEGACAAYYQYGAVPP
ncbi:MAG: hydrogenase formation protein HypD [Acidobacteria bacterium]|nr:hydrogenase formation protein HypD [Acidobacteriota bacterium]